MAEHTAHSDRGSRLGLTCRRIWLPIRRRFLPGGSRRDLLYRLLRFSAWRCREWVSDPVGIRREPTEYARFQTQYEPGRAELAAQRYDASEHPHWAVFSIATAVYRPGWRVFRQTALSVRRQTYPYWQWHVVDASPHGLASLYLRLLAWRDPRLRLQRLPANEGIAGNFNHALKASTGEFLMMLDHDDTLAPWALFEFARAFREMPSAEVAYSDFDKLDEHGHRCEPFFKPGWSPELLLCANYIEHVVVFRRQLLDRVGVLSPAYDGADDWDLYLRMAESTQAFMHVPQILYHWRKTNKSTAQTIENKSGIRRSQQRAVASHLARRGLAEVSVTFNEHHPIHRHYPKLAWKSHQPMVSIVIPTKDHAEVLSACLEGLFERTSYPHFEVVLLDTGSNEPSTVALYETLRNRPAVRFFWYREPFNFSRVCNLGVSNATGELILLLNNDTEVLNHDWLERMVQWFEIPSIGVVGPKMFYPDGRLHHGGVIVGMGGLASILFLNGREHVNSMFGPEGWYRNLSAVSGACLLTRRALYDALGGLDERFLLNYSDVDFCVRANAAGFRVMFTPDARLVHHESVTHGHRVPRTDFLEASRAWQSLLQNGDPFFNPNLSVRNCYPSFRADARDNPRAANLELLARLPNKQIIEPGDLDPKSA
jgi:GT2 family glycosyltransferase